MDKALSLLRDMEVDKAVTIFYGLLAKQPNDESIINRIYPLALNSANKQGLVKIARHIFSLDSNSESAHRLVIKAYCDLKNHVPEALDYSKYTASELYCLLFHLSQTDFQKDAEVIVQHIKTNLPEEKRTPEALFYFCERLVLQRKWLLAKQELQYLMIYYTESKLQAQVEKLFKKITQ